MAEASTALLELLLELLEQLELLLMMERFQISAVQDSGQCHINLEMYAQYHQGTEISNLISFSSLSTHTP